MFMLCFTTLHVHCIHLARGMIRMRIPSTLPQAIQDLIAERISARL